MWAAKLSPYLISQKTQAEPGHIMVWPEEMKAGQVWSDL